MALSEPRQHPLEQVAAWPPALLAELTGNQRNGLAPAVGETISKGERNTTLTSLAGSMRRRGMSEAAIHAALSAENRDRCRPPLPDRDIARIAASIARYPAAETHAPAWAPEHAGLFKPQPVDWDSAIATGIPQLEYVSKPYLPRRRRVWWVGPAASGKSIYAAHESAKATRQGDIVVYLSQENGLEEELRRFLRLEPAYEHLHLYVDQGFDLAQPAHITTLIEVSAGAALVIIDTLTACWSGNEDSNAEIATLDRDCLQPLIRESGATPVILDHTGNPSLVRRRGVNAPRGASAKGQKADFLLEFTASSTNRFTIYHSKGRGRAGTATAQTYEVFDTPDGGLGITETEATADTRIADLADALVDEITDAGYLTTKKLREAAQKHGAGQRRTNDAIELLQSEDPRRVTDKDETVTIHDRRRRARVWRPA